MAGSGTSLWPTLTAGKKAKASEVEFKFDWLEANVLPMLSGSTTDLAYDLGTSTARWNFGNIDKLVSRCINATSTANGLAIGTTTVANNSDVALEIAGIRSFLLPRLTTTQKNNLAGINGMTVYDSTLNQFYAYENGSWKAMLGNPIGFVYPVTASVTSAVTTTVLAVSAPGRLLRIGSRIAGGGGSTNTVKLEVNLDGIIYGDTTNANTGATSWLYLANTETALTAATMIFTSTAQDYHGLELYFKNTLNVYHRSSGGSDSIATRVYYERT